MDLLAAGESLAYEVAFFAEGLQSDLPLGERGDLTQKLIHKTQALAILALLAKGDLDKFHHNLIRAALLRERFLKYVRDKGIEGAYHHCAGRVAGLLGATIAEDTSLCKRIIALTPAKFDPSMEYQDDYIFAMVVQRLISVDGSQSDVAQLFAGCSAVEGCDTERFKVLEAIHSRDAKAFHEAFSALIAARATQIAADKKRGQLEEADVAAHRLVFVTGLALLKIAIAHRIAVVDQYQFCPAAALVPMSIPFPGQ